MEEKLNRLLQKATKILDENTDLLIITHLEGNCGVVTHGNTDNLAQSIFSSMHQSERPISEVLYRIVKLNVMNILANPSPYSADFLDAINNVLPDHEED